MMTFTDVPLDNKFAYIYQQGGHPIRLPEQAISGKNMAFIEPDDAWKARMRLEAWGPGYSGPEKYASDESEIMRRLLDFGGYAVVMAWHESDAEAILERGQLWYGDRIIMQKGEPSQCHTNSAMLWEANKSRTLEGPYREELALATGYAMSEDGLWRQHSWCVLRTPARVKVVETTVLKVAYYGFVMTHAEAERFAERSV